MSTDADRPADSSPAAARAGPGGGASPPSSSSSSWGCSRWSRPSRSPARSTTTGRTVPTSSAPGRSATATRWTRAVKAGALDEVSADWLQSRADGSRRRTAPRHRLHRGGQAQGLPCVRHAHRLQRDDAHASTRRSPRRSSPHRRLGGGTPPPSPTGCAPTTWPAWTWTGRPSRGRDRDEFSAFVEELARRLHDDGRLIAVDVYPKTTEPGGWDGPRAQDWKRLGRAVDQFRVMTYNFSGSWSGPGPLSPPEWMDRVIELRRDPGGAAAHRHGPRLLRPRVAGVLHRGPHLGRRRARSARPCIPRRRALRRASSTSPTSGTVSATRRSSPTPRPCAPSWRCSSRVILICAASTPGRWDRRTRARGASWHARCTLVLATDTAFSGPAGRTACPVRRRASSRTDDGGRRAALARRPPATTSRVEPGGLSPDA